MMRLFLFSLVVCMAFALPAAADEPAPQDGVRVQIVTDQQAGAVRIVIDGRQVAIIDATGLHVREDINFGGKTVDYGQAGFDEHATKLEEGPDAQ